MTIKKLPSSSSSLSKQVPSKAAPFVSKHSSPADRKVNSDAGLQSTDKRRSYMRRGSKTPTMLLLSSLDFNFLNQDLSESIGHASEPPLIYEQVRFEDFTIRRALDAATVCASADNDLQSIRTKRRFMLRGSESPNMLFNSELETANNRKLEETIQPAERRMSVMTALKQNFEKTTISTTSHPLCRHISIDLLM
jgi:hypothetical protein